MLYSRYGSGVKVRVGRGVAVGVAVRVGSEMCASLTEAVDVTRKGAFLPQDARKYAKSTINESVNFMEM